MAYLTINGTDFSKLVSELRVTKAHNYNAQTNAAGDTVVDYINAKRTIEVGFKPMMAAEVKPLLAALDAFRVTVGYRDPITNAMVSGVTCIAQPGGSIRDDLVIEKCNEYGMAMAFTGMRLFHH